MASKWAAMFPPGDGRLRPVVESLSQRYLGADVSSVATKHGGVTLRSLPSLASKHFPPCMYHMVDRLAAEAHLKHAARQQLGLFLKSIGLPLEDALAFWKTNFGPKVPGESAAAAAAIATHTSALACRLPVFAASCIILLTIGLLPHTCARATLAPLLLSSSLSLLCPYF